MLRSLLHVGLYRRYTDGALSCTCSDSCCWDSGLDQAQNVANRNHMQIRCQHELFQVHHCCCCRPAFADDTKLLCDATCASNLESTEMVTTPTGLQYKDIKVGTGPSPITGYQIVVNYVAQTPKGFVFENSLEKSPFDIRVGAGQVRLAPSL